MILFKKQNPSNPTVPVVPASPSLSTCLVCQMCVPLILMDKLSLAEAYVQDHADLQERLIRLLDSWCSPDFNLENVRR